MTTNNEHVKALSLLAHLAEYCPSLKGDIEAAVRALESQAGVSAPRVASVPDYSDASLVERAVRAASRGRAPAARWAQVSDAFSLGSGYSRQLCDRFGLNPDAVIGDDDGATDSTAPSEAREGSPCDMGELCIGCEPRNGDESCPDAQLPVGTRVTLNVRGRDGEPGTIKGYGDGVYRCRLDSGAMLYGYRRHRFTVVKEPDHD